MFNRVTISLIGSAIVGLGVYLVASTDQARSQAQSGGDRSPAEIASLEATVPENPLKDAYFGETHLHTAYSLDAYVGGARLTPDDAYRFAVGEVVTLNGQQHRLKRPLDFAAVTDHAEYIGEVYSTMTPGAPGYDNPVLATLRSLTKFEDLEHWYVEYFQKPMRAGMKGHPDYWAGPETTRSAWKMMVDTAQKHYAPGRFTTIVGFEWTSVVQGGNMHRNILFRDTKVPVEPFSAIDSTDEEKLWDWMELQQRSGSRLFAIPHNSNASKGVMFEPMDNQGRPIDAAYARRRSAWEPLIEMMQIKGNSEVVASLWPADEFAGFENAPTLQDSNGRTFKKQSFVRWAVIKGLDYQAKLGANPYQLGFIGGTDTHNGTPSDTAEDNFIGSHGAADADPKTRQTGDLAGWARVRDINPGSIAGVWATKNTRGAIWDAMKSRETFATSGTRMKVRMFGGARLSAPENERRLVEEGYRSGVPMGGVLKQLAKAPTFTVWAQKDPDGANLDRIQIVKGWVDASGEPQEQVVDVVWAGNRKRGANGKVAAIGSTVDLKAASYTNSIGASVLMGHWTDPDWRPEQNAIYYVRAIEIPTPRWSTYDAVRNKLPLLQNVPSTIQERAWGSPIWYLPG